MTSVKLMDPGELHTDSLDPAGQAWFVVDLASGELQYRAEPAGWGEPQISVPAPLLTAAAAARLMHDVGPDVQELLDRIDTAGKLDLAVAEQMIRLQKTITDTVWSVDAEHRVQIVDVGNWIRDRFTTTAEWLTAVGVTADSTDADLEAIAAAEEARAAARAGFGRVAIVGLRQVLTDGRDGERVRADAALAADTETLAELLRRRDEQIRRRAAWGYTDRATAELAGVSHPTVGARVLLSRAAIRQVQEHIAAGEWLWKRHEWVMPLDGGGLFLAAAYGGEVRVVLEENAQPVPTGVWVSRPGPGV